MELIKRKSNKTYTGSDKKEHFYYNYYLQCDNGKRIAVKPVNKDDYARFDMVCKYER